MKSFLSYSEFLNEDKAPIDTSKSQKKYFVGLPKSTAQKKRAQINKQAEMSDDSPSSYKPLPGDEKAREEGRVKTSSHVKKYKEMFGESEILEKESELKKGPIGNEKIEKALDKKAKESGVSIDILRVVMRRGMAAWKAGHRPGATQEQWGYARIASFLTKGPTFKSTDSDMADEAKKRGQIK